MMAFLECCAGVFLISASACILAWTYTFLRQL